MDALLRLDGEVDLVQGTQDLVDLADLGLVLEVDGGVEVGDFGVDGAADQLAFGGVQEFTHFCDVGVSYFSVPPLSFQMLMRSYSPKTASGGP